MIYLKFKITSYVPIKRTFLHFYWQNISQYRKPSLLSSFFICSHNNKIHYLCFLTCPSELQWPSLVAFVHFVMAGNNWWLKQLLCMVATVFTAHVCANCTVLTCAVANFDKESGIDLGFCHSYTTKKAHQEPFSASSRHYRVICAKWLSVNYYSDTLNDT